MYVIQAKPAPPFEFVTPDGTERAIPAFSSLPASRIAALARAVDRPRPKGAVLDAMAEEALAIFEAYAPGVTDELTVDQFVELARAYYGMAAPDGATAGESSGSSD